MGRLYTYKCVQIKEMNPVSLLKNSTKSVSIEITTCCPLNCVYCERKIHNKTLSFDEFLYLKSIIKQQPLINRITFCGIGEAFLHKDFYRMLQHLSDYKITIITSGTILVDFDKLSEMENVDILIFSIDSVSREKVVDICGENYNYDNLLTNLENLKKYCKQALRKRKFVTSIINCTINKSNIEDIVNMVDFAFKYGFSGIHFSLPWGNYELVKEQHQILVEQFNKAMDKAKRYGIVMENPFNSYCCITHDHIMPYIDVNGNMYYCAYGLNKKEVLGNIKVDAFDDMKTNPIYLDYISGDKCKICDMTEFCNLERR
ncbi:radical SAM protein [Ruminiclostridium herbifermentans]